MHLTSGTLLILSGILAYFSSGIEMFLSWVIFGAMFVSMSDIGENEMSEDKKNHYKHSVRRLFGYCGVVFSLALFVYYLLNI